MLYKITRECGRPTAETGGKFRVRICERKQNTDKGKWGC